MAGKTDAGLGLGVHDGEEAREVDKGTHGLGLTAEDPIGFDDKEAEEEEEVPVAKKARVEKADNGLAGEDEDAGGVEGLAEKEVDETELDPLLGHDNGAAESPVEGEGEGEEEEEEEEENGEEDDGEEDDESAEVDGVTGKDPPGTAGLRTLLQESDASKPAGGAVLNGTDADAHARTLNGAK